jgi:two-component sensor histidine kinase
MLFATNAKPARPTLNVTTSQVRREAVLTGELEHRVNNTLAVVVAVVERTRENTH